MISRPRTEARASCRAAIAGCRSRRPQALGHPDEVRLRAPAGSVFLFNGATWHATGSNETDEARVCLICFCRRSFLKPMFDFVRHIEPAVAARATGEMRRIYGFDSQPQGPDVAEGQAR